ncbi:MAG: UDP-N-acetylmuramate--L-alanine ligase [Bacillota bacterium]
MNIFKGIRRIHFVGIGGISMSGLAEIMLHNGYEVSGSDISDGSLIEKLRSHGAKITIPHSIDCVDGSDLVVYTAAVKQDNPELLRARELNIPVIDRAAFLGTIMSNYKYGIAIAGCHGKTTTTSLVSLIFKNASLDPTILIGGELDAIDGNVHAGNSEYFITEACEYVESFLKFHPFAAAILNIEEDHLDYFRDLQHIIQAFVKFVQLVPKEGCLVVCADNKNAMTAARAAKCNVLTYGIKNKADFYASKIKFNSLGYPSFSVYFRKEALGRFTLKIPGVHNVLNALAAAAIAVNAGIAVDVIRDSLKEYKGTHRRFDIQGTKNNITVVDDYAHHPTEIKATLEAAKQYPHNKIWCVFQPHTYSRTKTLLNDFASAFHDADSVIVADIYASREKNSGEIHSSTLAERINTVSHNARYYDDFSQIARVIANEARPGDLVFTMGAGDIYKLAPLILDNIK